MDFIVNNKPTKFFASFGKPEIYITDDAIRIRGLIADSSFNSWFEENEKLRANQNGYTRRESTVVGSNRLSNYDVEFAEILFSQLAPIITKLSLDYSSDLSGDFEWVPRGINPLFRGIEYTKGDALVAHYDDSYVQNEKTRSLMSVVIYVTGGQTRFMDDPRIDHEYKDFELWGDRLSRPINAEPGDILIFNHRKFHDGPTVTEQKRIIRTDLMFTIK